MSDPNHPMHRDDAATTPLSDNAFSDRVLARLRAHRRRRGALFMAGAAATLGIVALAWTLVPERAPTRLPVDAGDIVALLVLAFAIGVTWLLADTFDAPRTRHRSAHEDDASRRRP